MKTPGHTDPCSCGSGRTYEQCCAPRERTPTPGDRPALAVADIPKAVQSALNHHHAGRLSQAEAIYQQVLQAVPDHDKALHLLGLIANQKGEYDRAAELMSRSIRKNPSSPAYYYNLGVVYSTAGRPDEAIACYQRALEIKPDYAEAHSSLGVVLSAQGRHAEAIGCYRKALAIRPDEVRFLKNMGNALKDQGKPDEAVACYRKALALKPDDVATVNNLGNALRNRGKLDEAIVCYQQALALKPDDAWLLNNLGNALKDQGKPDEAMACYREALAISPDFAVAHNNKLLAAHYATLHSPAELYAEHLKFAAQFETPLKDAWRYHGNRRDPEKRLKIGYVSRDFRHHAVACFIEPVLVHHNKAQVEVFCYYTFNLHDSFTSRLMAAADHWLQCADMSDDQLAERIRADDIDILVDLAGHTGGNRLLVFARKPAPVQVTYLGYPDTTGLSAMDYRLTDALSDPEGEEVYYSEELVRLPGGFLCYQAPADSPVVAPPPVLATGHVTFGSFNNLAKINPEVVALWAQLLTSVDGSRLIIKNLSLDDPAMRVRYYRLFEEQGVARERIDLLGRTTSVTDHLALYARLDIALDTFPYNGATTTCEAMWMGVPVVTLAGVRHSGRVGVSLLNTVGLQEWIAKTPKHYVNIAVGLAGDPERLQTLRTGLRTRVAASALRDEAGFTRRLESAYRDMWRKWCVT